MFHKIILLIVSLMIYSFALAGVYKTSDSSFSYPNCAGYTIDISITGYTKQNNIDKYTVVATEAYLQNNTSLIAANDVKFKTTLNTVYTIYITNTEDDKISTGAAFISRLGNGKLVLTFYYMQPFMKMTKPDPFQNPAVASYADTLKEAPLHTENQELFHNTIKTFIEAGSHVLYSNHCAVLVTTILSGVKVSEKETGKLHINRKSVVYRVLEKNVFEHGQ